MRPWAATFDLISGEYGWSDDQILDLTLSRMRQIREVIWSRKDADWRRLVRLEEAKLRHQVAATLAAAGDAKGAKQAGSIELLARSEEEEAQERRVKVPSTREASRMFPIDPAHPPIDPDEFTRLVEEEKARRAAEAAAAGEDGAS